MTLYTLPNMSSGMDTAIVGTITAVPIFAPMFLLFVFMVVLMGGMGSQKRRTGNADMPLWGTLAGLSTFMITLAMSMIEGMINLATLGIVIAVTITFAVWLFLDRRSTEI